MLLGTTAGFGDLLGIARLDRLEAMGVQSVRQSVRAGKALPRDIVAEFMGRRVRPWFLIHDAAINEALDAAALPLLGPDGYDKQVFNEPYTPDFTGTIDQWVNGINVVYDDSRARGFKGKVVAGGVMNLEGKNWKWLEQSVPRLRPDVVVDFHRYPPGSQNHYLEPQKGFKSREEEIEKVTKLAAGHLISVSEFGYHTAPEMDGGRQVRLTIQQVHDFVLHDAQFFGGYPNIYAAHQYQEISGANPDYFLDCFGILAYPHGITPIPPVDQWAINPVGQVFSEWRTVMTAQMKQTRVRQVGETWALAKDQTVPLAGGGWWSAKEGETLSFGPQGWEKPTKAGQAGAYELTKHNAAFVTFNPPGGEPGIFPFQAEVPNEPGVSLIAMSDPQ